MENTGGSRAGYTELGQLVQQRAFARADRAHPSSGGGKRLLSANGRSGQSGLTKTKQPPENPGQFSGSILLVLELGQIQARTFIPAYSSDCLFHAESSRL